MRIPPKRLGRNLGWIITGTKNEVPETLLRAGGVSVRGQEIIRFELGHLFPDRNNGPPSHKSYSSSSSSSLPDKITSLAFSLIMKIGSMT